MFYCCFLSSYWILSNHLLQMDVAVVCAVLNVFVCLGRTYGNTAIAYIILSQIHLSIMTITSFFRYIVYKQNMKEQNMYSMVLPVWRSERKWISAFFWTKRVAIILAFNLIGFDDTNSMRSKREFFNSW